MKILIPIDEYFRLSLTGLRSYIVIGIEEKYYYESIEGHEEHIHIEPLAINNLFQLWPLKEWMASCEHRALLSAQSTQERESRRAASEVLIIATDKLTVALGSREKAIDMVKRCQAGEFPLIAAKLGIVQKPTTNKLQDLVDELNQNL